MSGYAGGSAGPLTVIEDLLRDALTSAVGPFPHPSTTASLTWNAIRPDGEVNLPTATVTWPAHGPATNVRGTSAADGGPDDASSGTPVSGDEPNGASEPVDGDRLVAPG